MQNRQAVLENLALVNTLKVISQAYEEISVMRMQKIRGSVLKSRDFLANLAGVYYDVKHSHQKFVDFLKKTKELDDFSPYSLLPQNGKSLIVLLAANEKMNGDVLSKVFRVFIERVKSDEKCDIMIIGRIGREMFETSPYKRTFAYFEAPDTEVRTEDIKKMIYYMVNYEQIDVFYGKFQNIVNQDPVVANISGDKSFENKDLTQPSESQEDQERSFVFEPSLEELNQFFETQFFVALLKQTVDESHLSRYASRIKAMEEALGNIETKSKMLNSEARKIKKASMNKKQNESIAGMALW